MFSSVDYWPSSQFSFIPIVAGAYPFENIDKLPVFMRQSVEECVSCHRPLDFLSRDQDKFRCAWCQKQIKPTNVDNASEQCQHASFIIRESEQTKEPYNLVLALDTCCGGRYTQKLCKYLIRAIESLPEDQPFHLAIIQHWFITWVFVKNNTVVLFDTGYGTCVSKRLNMTRKTNYRRILDVIKPYLMTIRGETDTKHTVDSLIEQLSDKDAPFSRIVLFSTRGPTRRETKRIFVDWITPTNDAKPNIDGYFLAAGSTGEENMDHQIARMMDKITSWTPIFDVEVNGYTNGYRITQPRFEYAAALDHFSQIFKITSGFTRVPVFVVGMEVKYLRFVKDSVFQETIWIVNKFKRSGDFIPICSGLRPRVLIPVLAEEGCLEKFVKELLVQYTQNCAMTIAGKAQDNTFGAIPECQWFLDVMFHEHEQKKSKRRMFSTSGDMFIQHYPGISYWSDVNRCIAKECKRDEFFYKMMGRPPICVADFASEIVVYGLGGEQDIDANSALRAFLDTCVHSRFPQPSIRYDTIDNLPTSGLFYQKQKFLDFVKNKLATGL